MFSIVIVNEKSVWACEDGMSLADWNSWLTNNGVTVFSLKPMLEP